MINNEKGRCPVCMLKAIFELSTRDTYRVNCIKCGKFEISGTALTMFTRNEEQTKIQSVSYWIKHHQSPSDKFVYIDLERMRKLLVPFIEPKPNEQAYNLIVWLGDNLNKPSEFLEIQWGEAESIIGTTGQSGISYVVRYLESREFISVPLKTGPLRIGLKFAGWDYYYELQNSNKNSRLAFMAMKFGDATLNTIYNDVIKTAVAETGFEIRKLDDVKRAGLIDDKLRVEIRRSKFLIADLTHANNGAYWEAGFAEGLGLHVIYICEKEIFNDKTKSTHFDTNHHLTVLWENTQEGLEQFSLELKSTIRATLPGEARMED